MHGLSFGVSAATVVLVCAGTGEMVRPWRPRGDATAQRWRANVALFGLSYGLGLALSPVVAAMVAAAHVHLGLVERLNEAAVRLAVAIVCLDFLDYLLHRASHRVSPLWRVHQAHHSDNELDITTTFRHHPLEAALTSLVIFGSGLLMGFTIPEIVTYGALSVAVQVVAHANLVLPRWLTDLVAPVLVTPDFHRLHHSRQWSQADANYGQVFSVWDRIFGTHGNSEAGAVEFGLDAWRKPQTQRLSWLLAQPMLGADAQTYPVRAPRDAPAP